MKGIANLLTRVGALAPLVLLAWLLLPNAALVVVSKISALQALCINLLSLLMFSLPVILVNSVRAVFLFNAPAALLSGMVTAYTMMYQSPITSGLIQSLLMTDARELHEHIFGYSLAALLTATGFACYLLMAWRLPGRIIAGRGILAAGSLWAVVISIYAPYFAFEMHERFQLSLDTSFARLAFPLNVLDASRSALAQRAGRTGWEATPAGVDRLPVQPRRIYVLVIGESTRAQTFSEVAADTGLLAQIPGLVQFQDVLAQANFTDASLPMLLTGARTLEESAANTSLIQWQNAANCVTAVISNNTSFAMSGAAQIRDTAGDGGIMHLTRYDHDMLDSVSGLLEGTAPRHLCLILHMAGSHFDYSARYRSEFEHYPVGGDDVQKLRAAYRNSVVMVQDFLNRLVALLEHVDAESLLIFASDHGENLLEIDGLREHVSNRPTEYELRVPLVVWGNERFRAAHADQWALLRDNRLQPVSNASVTPTLLDLMGIPDHAFPSARSLFRMQHRSERLFVHPDLSLHDESDMVLAPEAQPDDAAEQRSPARPGPDG